MTASSLVLKRALAHSSLLAALLVTAAVLAFTVAGTLGYLETSSVRGVHSMLSEAPATAAAIQVQTTVAGNPARQSTTADRLFARLLQGVPATVHRTLRTDALELRNVNEAAPRAPTQLVLGSDSSLTKHVSIIEGSWPAATAGADGAPAPAALQATAARALGIRVGDELELGTATTSSRVTVAATWLPSDPSDPLWFDEAAPASGFDGTALGPLIVDEAVLAGLPTHTSVRWTIVPDAAGIEPGELSGLATATGRIEKEAGHSALVVDSASTVSELPRTLSGILQALDAARSIVAVQLVLVLSIGLITLGALARLLSTVRRAETALLRGRGCTVPRMTVAALGEAACLVVPGALAGTAAAGLTLAAITGTGTDGTMLWISGLAVALVASILCGGVAWHGAIGSAAQSGREGLPRERGGMTGLAILVFIVAAVSLWQFSQHSSTPVAGATLQLDVLAMLAPALCLVALALLCLLGIGPALAILQSLAGRVRGISPFLPSRQLARNPTVFSVAVLVIILSVGGATLASALSATWSSTDAASAQLRNGADVRVRLDTQLTAGEPGAPSAAAPYASIPSVSDAAPVLTAPVRIGSEDVALTALSAAALPRVIPSIDARFDANGVASLLSSRQRGAALPANASTVTVVLSATATGGAAGTIAPSLWVADSDGALMRVPLGERPITTVVSDGAALTATLPVAHGTWRVLAVEATLSGSPEGSTVVVSFDRIEAGEAISTTPAKVTVSWGTPTASTMLIGRAAATEAVPVVVTKALAAHLGITTGDPLSFVLSTTGQTVSAAIVGQTALLPGSTNSYGMIADLSRLDEYLLGNDGLAAQFNEVWIATDAPDTVVAQAHSLSRVAATVTTVASHSSEAMIAPAVSVFWAGMWGALLLGAIAVLAVVVTLSEQRRGEIAVLRALGMTRQGQSRARLAELGTVAAAALVFGILCGCAVSALTAGGLTRIAADVPPALPTTLQFAVVPWLALLGTFLAGLLIVGGLYGARIRRQAAQATQREWLR